MNTQDWIEKYKKIIQDEWFKNHKATLQTAVAQQSPCVTIIDWSRQGSSIYLIRYMLYSGYLFVCGDVGEATYRWGEVITPEWLANTDFGYFFEKCVASEMGRRHYCWSPTLAESRAKELIAQRPHVVPNHIVTRLCNISYGTEYDCQESLSELIRKGFDSDYASSIIEAGKPPHPRAIAHWMGMKMAVSQLNGTPLKV